ncbi:hypothetical protein MFLO_05325 [Listeria floridensis FSL S10-1187]|uniref:DUF3958 domain-containing protein n=1 Tax=Listeria floridensis FSL S10-1187 TaxID=1265817 RepID=A0ABN0RGT0_9LIST|nr:DUF3958 family protein [Listeria floridensis]EUJ33008.1 hypothetical protein MFLO_05325 [Listeria floridensis FSL S10-1187]
MKTPESYQQEEQLLLRKEEENLQKRREIERLKESYETHFRQGLRFMDGLRYTFRQNDRAFIHENMQDRVFAFSHSIRDDLEETAELYQREKRQLEDQLNEIAYEKRKARLEEREGLG